MDCKNLYLCMYVVYSRDLFTFSSYHSSMLPSLFAYEGSTNPVRLPKKSSLHRRQVVQVEVNSEVSSSRERRSETPSPENVIDTSNISGIMYVALWLCLLEVCNHNTSV